MIDERLSTRPTQEIATYDPGLAAGDEAGMENISGSDLKVAFLQIAQKTSKAIDRSEAKYIQGLEFGQMYNSVTGEIYNGLALPNQPATPLEFIPVKLQKDARLKNDDGTLGDHVDWNDPRVIPPWEPGSRVATVDELEGVRIYNWAGVLPATFERVIISFSSTNFVSGKDLHNILDKSRQIARLAGKGFRNFQVKVGITTAIERDGGNSWGKFKIALAGGTTKEQYEFCAAWYEAIKDREVEGVVDESESEPVERENQPAATTTRKDGDIPF